LTTLLHGVDGLLELPRFAANVSVHFKDEVVVDHQEVTLFGTQADRGGLPKPSLLGILFDEDHVDYREHPWWAVATARRHSHHPKAYQRSIKIFLNSAGLVEVSCVITSMVLFVWMYGYFADWPHQQTPHAYFLVLWIAWGFMCAGVIHFSYTPHESTGWITGYLLEFIFSIENVFVFHVVSQAFKAPSRLSQKALFCVVLGQIVFQAIFFMGLAHWLHRSIVLPYLLGIWLLYVGYEAARTSHHDIYDIRETFVYTFFRQIMGERLSPEFNEDGTMFVTTEKGSLGCTMLVPLAICLFIIDVLLEVDVTLTKIETLDKDFMCFSSSVVAACAVPELYFVARSVFERFKLLRYGVAFALFFYGMQLLLHQLFELPALAGILVVILVMALCIIASKMQQPPAKGDLQSDEVEPVPPVVDEA
jgi:tellurite resistance protein TerC